MKYTGRDIDGDEPHGCSVQPEYAETTHGPSSPFADTIDEIPEGIFRFRVMTSVHLMVRHGVSCGDIIAQHGSLVFRQAVRIIKHGAPVAKSVNARVINDPSMRNAGSNPAGSPPNSRAMVTGDYPGSGGSIPQSSPTHKGQK